MNGRNDQGYRMKLRSDKLKGKYRCPECERRFHTGVARQNHGYTMHGWRCEEIQFQNTWTTQQASA